MKNFFLISLLLIGLSDLYSQNITNTLGASGLFSVKDGSTTFLSLNQANGYLSLTNSLILSNTTSPNLGVIYKDGVRFIHNYGNSNTFIGSNSGNFTMTGIGNTAIGVYSLLSNTTGFFNVALGEWALGANRGGSYNTAVGYYALSNSTDGNNNTSLGAYSLTSNNLGGSNTALGAFSLSINSNGYGNTAAGFRSLNNNIQGNNNTALGSTSLIYNTYGNSNTSSGSESLYHNTVGSNNSAFGFGSLNTNTEGNDNTAVGHTALNKNIAGINNTAVGKSSLFNNTGSYNTAIGFNSLINSTNNYNTAIGHNAGSTVTTGENLSLIGIDANPSAPTVFDEITLGNIYVNKLRCNATTITSLSDRRDKKNITDLTLGLEFITKLKPRQFNWDKRDWYEARVSDGSKMQETPTAGFIAQELDSIQTEENAEWLDLVLKSNPEKWEATPGNLFPIVVKAIQELKVENEKLKTKLERFEETQLLLVKKLDEIENNSQKTTNLYTQAIQGN